MRQIRFPLFASILLLAAACGGQPATGNDSTVSASNADVAGKTCGGFVGLTCADSGTYCAFATGSCGIADAAGTCKARPQACAQVEEPVCGCDGTTYSNGCMAAVAGISVKAKGPCATPAQDPVNLSGKDAGTLVSLLDAAGAQTRSVPDMMWYAAQEIGCSVNTGIAGPVVSCEVVLKDGSSKSLDGKTSQSFVDLLNQQSVPARHFVEATAWTLDNVSCTVGTFAFPNVSQNCSFTPVLDAETR